MATAAEPLPAELPLPGGRPGATLRVHPLLTGSATAPPAMVHREEGRLAGWKALGLTLPASARMRLPVPAFLIEHPGAGLVLVDTGLHPSVAVDPGQVFGRLGGVIFKDVEMDAEQAVPAQMRELGLEADNVSTVVMTHLHGDHASGISQFPAATFVLSEPEWRAAAAGGGAQGYQHHHFDHAFDYRLLDFEGEAADSFATFGRAIDLFGDGSIRLVSTPGHSTGHQSVVLRLTGRELLLTGDAAYTMRTIAETAVPHRMADEHFFRRSLREIQLYAERTPTAVIIPGHDMARWEELEPLYT
jgi:glyoxylase-like metal-dependent hydrolase (beta-lactamase superfamily II)